MRATKVAIAEALRIDPAVSELVPPGQVFAVERATVPVLPSIEILAIRSEASDYLVTHELSVECTVSHPTEDGADERLDGIVRAVRARLLTAQDTTDPIALPDSERLSIEVSDTRWSISASDASSVVRGASIAVAVQVND